MGPEVIIGIASGAGALAVGSLTGWFCGIAHRKKVAEAEKL